MKAITPLKRGLSKARRLWRDGRLDLALSEVDRLLGEWPDQRHLLLMRARLTQLQDDIEGTPSLDDAESDLERAVQLDEQSPDSLIELGYFRFVHHDDAKGASKYFERAVHRCVDMLSQALVGRAEALYELGREDKASNSLMTACSLAAQYRESLREDVLERIKDLLESALEADEAPSDAPRDERRAV